MQHLIGQANYATCAGVDVFAFVTIDQDRTISAWSVLDLSIDNVLIPPHRRSSNNALVMHNLAGVTSPRYEYTVIGGLINRILKNHTAEPRVSCNR